MIVALIVNGLTLPGARKGIEYYILKIDVNKLASLKAGLLLNRNIFHLNLFV
jgi:hypothetical protein